ncbi:MAG: hypothetical protein B7Y39_10380 [Bdellovibrio sp. 28-41-41]|nr:MAG: hypothetical protein B7Y39_10380 [Bdellovibrio sp. 28-41-41]
MKTCERCGQPFGCEASNKGKKCWCMDLPVVTMIPAQYKDCVCSNCLKEIATKKSENDLIEGLDYYLERGLFVFTEKYHLKKGKCCGNGCRHCPY